MTKAEYDVFTLRLFNLACNIGLRPAARALDISEDKARKIASRRKWNMAKLSPALKSNGGSELSPQVTAGIEETRHIIQHYGDRAKIGATIAGAKVFEHLADKNANQLIGPATAIAADQWSRCTDRAAGWTAERQRGAQINVAVINPPSAAKLEEIKLADAKLDEFTKLIMQPDQEQ